MSNDSLPGVLVNDKQLKLNNDILRIIECPSCFEHMRAPIYVCVRGHSMCFKCWEVLQKCPTCKSKLSEARCFTLEAVTESLMYPCPYSENGCQNTMSYVDINDHCNVCCCRSYKCIVDECEWHGLRQFLEEHYVSAHQQIVVHGPLVQYRWDIMKETKLTSVMKAFKEIFYVYRIVDRNKNIVHFVVQLIGKFQDAHQFYFKLNICTEEFDNRTIVIQENCQVDWKQPSEIIDCGFAAGVPTAVLETFKDTNLFVFYNLSVHKA